MGHSGVDQAQEVQLMGRKSNQYTLRGGLTPRGKLLSQVSSYNLCQWRVGGFNYIIHVCPLTDTLKM